MPMAGPEVHIDVARQQLHLMLDGATERTYPVSTALNGVGEAKAEAIVAYREEHGPFKSADQLAEVKGIGLKTVEKNRDLIDLGSKPAPTQ